MAKKIIILSGSPRKHGNTNTVVHWVAESARKEGVTVEVVDTASLKYSTNGCTACMGCQNSDRYECVINDEASPIIARIPQFDVMVLATPIYWMGPSAQLKLLLDRTFALVKFDPQTGEPIANPAARNKILALIATAGGGPADGLTLTDDTFRTAAKLTGCRYESLLVPHAPYDPNQLSANADLRQQAAVFGQQLAR